MTAGSANVSITGEANYSIPLVLPPGTNGLTPQLALVYNHRSGEGIAGVGWGLAGLSAITRCPKTWVQDGAPAQVFFTTADRFCLDGNQLKLVSGSYGVSGSTYRTEIDTFARITASGTAGNGPASFTVEQKNGLIYEYGNSTDSRVETLATSLTTTARTWVLTKIRDRSTNAIVFNYTEDGSPNGAFRISSINYTSNSSQGTSAPYTISFTYASHPAGDTTAGYWYGGLVKDTKRLTRIDATYTATSTLVRRYDLTYEGSLSSTGRSRLASVQECAGATPDCFAATTFTYIDGTSGYGSETSSGTTLASPGTALTIDINGDGRTDIVYSSSTGAGTWMYRLANASGTYDTAVNSGITNTAFGQAIAIDYTGDGFEDLMYPGSGSTWWVIQGSASGLISAVNTSITNQSISGQAIAIDMNGDGLDDLIYVDSSGNVKVRYRINPPGSGSFDSSATTLYTATHGFINITALIGNGQSPRSRARDIDINGDGMRDLALLIQEVTDDPPDTQYSSEVILGANGGSVYTLAAGNSYPALFMDINGDGLTDITYNIGAGTIRYQLSTGREFTSQVTGPSLTNLNFAKALVRDWDGDGYQDLLLPNTSTNTWYLMRSDGEALTTASNTSLSVSTPQAVYYSTDLNGDGLDDIAYANSSGVLVSRLHSGVMPDYLNRATDGYGSYVDFNYAPLTDTSGFYTKGTTATYPTREYQGGLWVVKTLDATDGIGGTYTKTYYWALARFDAQGRSFLGFGVKYEVDDRYGIVNSWDIKQDFPYIGMTWLFLARQGDWVKKIEETINTLSNQTYGTSYSTRYLPYVSQSVTKKWEVGGSYDNSLISTATTANTLDSTTGTIYDSTTTTVEESTANGVQSAASYVARTYHPTGNLTNDTTNWCIGRPGQTQLINSHSQYGGGSITRTTNRTWDGPTCRITQEVAEPGSGSWQVTRDIGYDAWGNVNSDAITGASMSARTTTASYSSSSGRFPSSVTNALSQATSFTWNAATGTRASQTDPNGLATSWQYDVFGRRTREDRPDGTYTTYAPAICAGPSYCGDGLLRSYVQITQFASGGATVNTSEQYFDAFNRIKYNEAANFAGGSSRSIVRYAYDDRGNITMRSLPYFTGGTSYWERFYYDLLGRLTQAQRQVSDSDPTWLNIDNYYEGLTTRIVDQLSKQTTKVANVMGGLAKSIDHDSYAQIFDYDAFGGAVRVTDSSSNTLQTITYNVRGMRTAMADMDMGSWGFTPNALGELVSQTDAKSQTTTFAYDAIGRMTSRVETEGTSTWTWGTSSGSKNIGRLASISGPGYSESYTYDSVSRLSNRSITSDATYAFDYSYNTMGTLDTLTYPTSTSSYRLKLQYDYQNSHLLRVKDYVTPFTAFWQANATDARGTVIDETLGNGLQTTVGVDQVTGLVDSIYTGTSGTIQNLAYTWDRAGNLTQRQDVRQSLTETFYYDNLHRLDYSQLNGSTNVDYTYNSLGNLTYKSDVGSYTYDATKKHQVTAAGSFSFAYDANGNASTRNGSSITWCSYNLPNTISASGSNSSQFFYAPDRSRWKQVASYAGTTETSIYIGGMVEKVTLGATTHWKHYISGGTGVVAVYTRKSDSTNAIHYLTQDHLGSIDSITNSGGTVEVRLSYASFGQRRNESGWTGNPTGGDWTQITDTSRHGFTGHEMLDNLSLTHMNGRVFDQVVGRFLSADPYVQALDYTQSYNRYAYTMNNPLRYTDPTGFWCDDKKGCPEPQPQPKDIPAPPENVPDLGKTEVTGCQICFTTMDQNFTAADREAFGALTQPLEVAGVGEGSKGSSENGSAAGNPAGNGRSSSCGASGVNAANAVLGGAAVGAAVGSIWASNIIVQNGVRIAATEAAVGVLSLLGVVDAIGNGTVAGFGVGGPWGAVVGGTIGLAAYGAYALATHSPSNPGNDSTTPGC